MKAHTPKKPKNAVNAQALLARAAAAEQLANAARDHLRMIKAEHKLARKAVKQARKAAKATRKEARLIVKSMKGAQKGKSTRPSKKPSKKAPPGLRNK